VTTKNNKRSSSTIPICPGCLKPMVLESKRPLPSTNFVEITYRCETCGFRTKRMVKEP